MIIKKVVTTSFRLWGYGSVFNCNSVILGKGITHVHVVKILTRTWSDCKLTHWGRVTHICVSKLTIIGPDNGLSPGRRKAIIWTNTGILLIGPLGTNFSEHLSGIQIFSFMKMPLKMSSGKWRPSCLGLNVLNSRHDIPSYYFAFCQVCVHVINACEQSCMMRFALSD